MIRSLLEFEDTSVNENEDLAETTPEKVDTLLTLEKTTSDDLLSDFVSNTTLSPTSQASTNFFLPSQLLSMQSKQANTSEAESEWSGHCA